MTTATCGVEIESAFLSALADKIGSSRFQTWLDAGVSVRATLAGVIVSATTSSLLDWVRLNFREPIVAVSRAIVGRELPIRFELAPVTSERLPSGTCKMTWNSPEASAMPILVSDPSRTQIAHTAHGVAAKPHQALLRHASPATEPTELANTVRSRTLMTFESLVVGIPNHLAKTVLDHVVAEPGTTTPLYLYGGSSVGKTHMLEATWHATSRRRKGPSPILMTAEQFTTRFVAAVRQSGVPNFRAKFRGVTMILIDDIPFLAGKRETQTELLHILDTLVAQRVQVIVTGDRPLTALTMLRPEIISRLSGGMVCEIKPPDDAMLLAIAQQMVRQRKLDVADDVCPYLVARVGGDVRRLSGALHRLHAVTLVAPQTITLSVARETLSELAGSGEALSTTSRLGLADIERVVCDEFGVAPSDLRSPSRSRSVAQPRMLAMWLARQHTRFALSEIGTFFGHRSHSTVLAAQKRVEAWMADEVAASANADDVEASTKTPPESISSAKTMTAVIAKIERRLSVAPSRRP